MEIRKAEDIFASLRERERSFPQQWSCYQGRLPGEIHRLQHRSNGYHKLRQQGRVQRDDDADVLEARMTRRGFIIADAENGDE